MKAKGNRPSEPIVEEEDSKSASVEAYSTFPTKEKVLNLLRKKNGVRTCLVIRSSIFSLSVFLFSIERASEPERCK
jgi:hypothetical protein